MNIRLKFTELSLASLQLQVATITNNYLQYCMLRVASTGDKQNF